MTDRETIQAPPGEDTGPHHEIPRDSGAPPTGIPSEPPWWWNAAMSEFRDLSQSIRDKLDKLDAIEQSVDFIKRQAQSYQQETRRRLRTQEEELEELQQQCRDCDVWKGKLEARHRDLTKRIEEIEARGDRG